MSFTRSYMGVDLLRKFQSNVLSLSNGDLLIFLAILDSLKLRGLDLLSREETVLRIGCRAGNRSSLCQLSSQFAFVLIFFLLSLKNLQSESLLVVPIYRWFELLWLTHATGDPTFIVDVFVDLT